MISLLKTTQTAVLQLPAEDVPTSQADCRDINSQVDCLRQNFRPEPTVILTSY